jgi:AraC-like DNA-binding protein
MRAPQTISGSFGEMLVTPDTRGRSPPHFHTTYAIGVGRAGAGKVFVRGRSWSYSAGMVVVTNPFEPHWGRASPGGVHYSLLYPRLDWLRGLAGLRHLPFLMHFERPVIADARLSERLRRAVDEVVQNGKDSLLGAAVASLFIRYARIAPPPENPLADGVPPGSGPIAGRAAEAGLSRAYYSRKYRQTTGLSPLDHRRQARVLAARSMIEAGVALAAAAAEAGFADQAHMTRQFRQILGVTPGVYRPDGGHTRSIP